MTSVNDRFWAEALKISEAKSDAEIRSGFVEVIGTLGFRAAYFLNPVAADARIGRRLLNLGFPKVWERHYPGRLALVDPLPRAALRHGSAFKWSEIDKILRLSRRQRKYFELLERFGIGDGIGMPCYGPGARRTFIGVGLPVSDDCITPESMLKVSALGQISFQRHLQLSRLSDLENPRLSQRELDVMQWIAQGKSNAVIAQILGISASTVDVYVSRIFEKLGVADRTSASVRALTLGVIRASPR